MARRAKNRATTTHSPRRGLWTRSAGSAVWTRRQRSLLAATLTSALVLSLALGLYKLCTYYLNHSGQFVLREVEVRGGDFIPASLVCEFFNLEQGMPLFGLNLSKRQNEFIRSAPTIRSMTIRRKLPDKICIQIVERDPVARIANYPFGVDTEGCVFVWRTGIDSLPSLSGYGSNQLAPGAYLSDMGMTALKLLETIKHNPLPLAIVDIDISKSDYLKCTMADQRMVKLAWHDLKKNDPATDRYLLAQLRGLAAVMNSQRGRGLTEWDATIQGRAYGR